MYSEEKTKLGKLFEDVSPELATDYDLLRETGINPRSSESFLKLASEDSRRHEAADIFEFLEEVGPGLLILLRSDFLQIAVKYPYHHIAPHSAFLQPQLLDAEGRERIEKVFENGQQADDSAHLGKIRAELFKVLCGADNGPWRRHFPSGIVSFWRLQSFNLGWLKSVGQQDANRLRCYLSTDHHPPPPHGVEETSMLTIMEKVAMSLII